MTIAFVGRPLVIPITSYSNTGGQGNRTGIITVTANFSWTEGTSNNLVDGGSAANPSDAVSKAAGSNAGHHITFDFGSQVYIDEATKTLNSSQNMGSWKWQASSDDVNYIDVSSTFAWDTTPEVVTLNPGQPEGFRYYRLTAVSGNWFFVYVFEFTFKIAAGAS